jgi:hypothetical protein
MKKIKRFNESSDIKSSKTIWCVLINDSDDYPMEDDCKCFYDQMHAADYYIEYINYYCEQKFETFFDEDGNRFFTSVEENEDFDEATLYVDSQGTDIIDITILEIPLYSTISKDIVDV